MKQTLLLSIVLLTFLSAFAQPNQWTWINGDSTVGQTGVFGSRGVTAPSNKLQSRGSGATWTDASGNFWVFGGYSRTVKDTGYLNDLWKYTPSTNLWTWVSGDSILNQPGSYGSKGTASSANKPGARQHAVSWTDLLGNLWLFGGYNDLPSSGVKSFNDLWRYNPAADQWTWISGDSIPNQRGIYGSLGIAAATNKPGARFGSTAIKDAAGDLWLFGGIGLAAANGGYLNDLWRYTPSTGQWTWVSGDSIIVQIGVYGNQGVVSPANKPGGRVYPNSWIDPSGNIWFFGGFGVASIALYYGPMNDLWKYTPSSNQWTWISGNSTVGADCVYGVKGTPSFTSRPGGRYTAVSWIDAAGNLWLLGGSGSTTGGGGGELNDLWKFTPSTGWWTWIGGDSTANLASVYGAKGSPAAVNKLGARSVAQSWTDAIGNLWVLGGAGYAANGAGFLNDLWRYSLAGAPLPSRLTSFNALDQRQTVVLRWSTAQEQNSLHFIVERSSAGMAYDSIGVVSAMGVTSGANYAFTDANPLQSTAFYRLKLVDVDGQPAYSPVVKLEKKEANLCTILQNPVQRDLQLRITLAAGEKLAFRVSDMNGHLLVTENRMGNQGSSVHSFPVNHLSRGIYMIHVQSKSINSTQTFIKQ